MPKQIVAKFEVTETDLEKGLKPNLMIGISITGNPKTTDHPEDSHQPDYLSAMVQSALAPASPFDFVGVLFGNFIQRHNERSPEELEDFTLHDTLLDICDFLFKHTIEDLQKEMYNHFIKNINSEIQTAYREHAPFSLDWKNNLELLIKVTQQYVDNLKTKEQTLSGVHPPSRSATPTHHVFSLITNTFNFSFLKDSHTINKIPTAIPLSPPGSPETFASKTSKEILKYKSLITSAQKIIAVSKENFEDFKNKVWEKSSPIILERINPSVKDAYSRRKATVPNKLQFFIGLLNAHVGKLEFATNDRARQTMANFWAKNRHAFLNLLTPEEKIELTKINALRVTNIEWNDMPFDESPFEKQIAKFNSVSKRLHLFLWEKFTTNRKSHKRQETASPTIYKTIDTSAEKYAVRRIKSDDKIRETINLEKIRELQNRRKEVRDAITNALREEISKLLQIKLPPNNNHEEPQLDAESLIFQTLFKTAKIYQTEEMETIPQYLLGDLDSDDKETCTYPFFAYPAGDSGFQEVFASHNKRLGEADKEAYHFIQIDFKETPEITEKKAQAYQQLMQDVSQIKTKGLTSKDLIKNIELAESDLVTEIAFFIYNAFNTKPYLTTLNQKLTIITDYLDTLKKEYKETKSSIQPSLDERFQLILTRGIFQGIEICETSLSFQEVLNKLLHHVFTPIAPKTFLTCDHKTQLAISKLIVSLYPTKEAAEKLGKKLFSNFSYNAAKPQKSPKKPQPKEAIELAENQTQTNNKIEQPRKLSQHLPLDSPYLAQVQNSKEEETPPPSPTQTNFNQQ